MIRVLLLLLWTVGTTSAMAQSGTIQVERPCDCTEVPAVLPDGSPIVPEEPGMGGLRGKLILQEGSSIDPRCIRIQIIKNDRTIAETCPNREGYYALMLLPESYSIRATGKGLIPKQINGVIVKPEKASFLNLKMMEGEEGPNKKRKGRKRRRK